MPRVFAASSTLCRSSRLRRTVILVLLAAPDRCCIKLPLHLLRARQRHLGTRRPPSGVRNRDGFAPKSLRRLFVRHGSNFVRRRKFLTARRLRRKKHSRVRHFLYVPLPVFAAASRGLGLPGLSQNVVICR
jgi:hypothetical protein